MARTGLILIRIAIQTYYEYAENNCSRVDETARKWYREKVCGARARKRLRGLWEEWRAPNNRAHV